MKTYTITKRQILKALKEEPLHAGQFINVDSLYGDEMAVKAKKRTDCEVCAVGAVLRNSIGNKITVSDILRFGDRLLDENSIIGVDTQHIISGVDTAVNMAIHLHPKNHMGQLSYVFENLYSHYYHLDGFNLKVRGPKMKALRYQLTKFVKDTFPNKIKVKI